MQRYPKGRAVRRKTVEKIVKAFESSGNERLTHKRIRELTGSSPRAVSNTLKEMIEHGSIVMETGILQSRQKIQQIHVTARQEMEMVTAMEQKFILN